MDIIQAILLGIIQGTTEFLPISSSAHLVIASDIFGFEIHSASFDVMLHGATLIAVVIYFWKDLWKYFFALFKREDDKREYSVALILAFIPIIIVGIFAFQNIDILRRTDIIASTLIISALALIVADYAARYGHIKDFSLKKKGIGIGLFQVIALIPGVSRSGITIAAGRSLGFSRREATRFSFLLAVPTIFASVIFIGFQGIKENGVTESFLHISIGSIVAGIVAYLVISFFMKWVERIGFLPFCIYQILLGLILLSYVAG